ncbi:hypothetical protein [Allorhizocola rhizosphaerae]|uniref:hypothetical protein n=1 Tax=Allorhizocola rhizosphaerae TaxID=1872709 RepID=UPI0013C361DD|nr:hypothetical protein [Allorhizocola rhizosphaerae]
MHETVMLPNLAQVTPMPRMQHLFSTGVVAGERLEYEYEFEIKHVGGERGRHLAAKQPEAILEDSRMVRIERAETVLNSEYATKEPIMMPGRGEINGNR